MIARCKQHKKIAEIATTAVAQPSNILDAGQRVASIAAYGEKFLMDCAAEERAGDFLAHHVVPDFIRKSQCGVRLHGEPSKSKRILQRVLLYDHPIVSAGEDQLAIAYLKRVMSKLAVCSLLALGTSLVAPHMSAFEGKADIAQTFRHVRFRPKADVWAAQLAYASLCAQPALEGGKSE